jgi:glycerophosphoryl diester phosphodiesterase
MPWLVAHRGAMAEAPENTTSSFNKALSYPIDGIELDVQITRDGIPVVFHDTYIKNKSNGSGRISDYTYAELCRFDWGTWFSKDYTGEKILSLAQVLKEYASRTRLFIEIKSAPHRSKISLYSQLPSLVTELIRQMVPSSMMDHIYILSFDQTLLASACKNDPGLNYVLNIEFPVLTEENLLMAMNSLCGFCLAFRRLTPEFISWSHHLGKNVLTYSCNTPGRIQLAFELKVDVIMTDSPGTVISSYRQYKKEY